MAESNVKQPISIPELATRAATYGALFLVAGGLLWLILHLTDAQEKRTSDLRADVISVRQNVETAQREVAKLREEYIEFKTQTNANFRRLEEQSARQHEQLRSDVAELKELLKGRR